MGVGVGVQVVSLICVLTAAFALLIWLGLQDNGIDAVAVAQVTRAQRGWGVGG